MLGRPSVTPFDFSVAGATPAPVLRTWHGRKLKGVHGRDAIGKGGSSTTQKDQPSQVFHHFAPGPFLRRSTNISQALRGHPRREHFVVIRGGVLKYAGQRRTRT